MIHWWYPNPLLPCRDLLKLCVEYGRGWVTICKYAGVVDLWATAEWLIATEFGTVLGDREGTVVSTAEHVLAALRGMGVDNATIEIDGPEVPIMDGSAAAFVTAIEQARIVSQSAQRRFIQVLKPVQVAIGGAFGALRPYAPPFPLPS